MSLNIQIWFKVWFVVQSYYFDEGLQQSAARMTNFVGRLQRLFVLEQQQLKKNGAGFSLWILVSVANESFRYCYVLLSKVI